MLGGKGKHIHSAFLEIVHPCVRIESRGIPGLIEVVVGLAIFEGHGEEGPGLGAAMPYRVDPPDNPDSELSVSEGFIGTRRSRMIFGDGRVLDVRIVRQQRGRKSMGRLCRLRQTGVDGRCCQSRGRRYKLSPVHDGPLLIN